MTRLVAALKLTPLAPSALTVVALPHPEPDVCLRFAARDAGLTLPLWQIEESTTGCYANVSTFEHPSSKLLFVRVRHSPSDPEWCGTTRDSIYWVPRTQLEAERQLLRGEQALSRQRRARAAPEVSGVADGEGASTVVAGGALGLGRHESPHANNDGPSQRRHIE